MLSTDKADEPMSPTSPTKSDKADSRQGQQKAENACPYRANGAVMATGQHRPVKAHACRTSGTDHQTRNTEHETGSRHDAYGLCPAFPGGLRGVPASGPKQFCEL